MCTTTADGSSTIYNAVPKVPPSTTKGTCTHKKEFQGIKWIQNQCGSITDKDACLSLDNFHGEIVAYTRQQNNWVTVKNHVETKMGSRLATFDEATTILKNQGV